VHSVLAEVFDRAKLDVVKVADLAMLIVLVADAVELQIGEAQSRLRRLAGELFFLREADSVGRALHGEIAELARISDRGEEMRREGRLSARKLNGELPPRLDRNSVVEKLLDFLPFQLMDESDLVGAHEPGVA